MVNKKIKTTDNKTYYSRHDYSDKINIVNSYIVKLDGVKNIIDFGCNNGEVSKNLLHNGYNVLGIDDSPNLNTPNGYNFIKANVLEYRKDITSDCSIFLSLYHHILGNYGLDIADDLFYKLFFNSKYLIFDTGNISEEQRSETYWYKEQIKHFNNEKHLLDHFGLEYSILGSYSVAGGIRNIVLFKNDKNIKVGNLGLFKRKVGSKKQKEGLSSVDKSESLELYNGTVFSKIKIGDKLFFTKKHKDNKINKKELGNTILINENYNEDYLIKFYGYNEKYGLIFEWLDSFIYNKKIKIKNSFIELNDVDEIIVNGKIKHIDFHW
jgi:hypothetical protein